MFLNDRQIRELCERENPLIEPFFDKLKQKEVISYGLSSCGYDIRASNKWKIYKNTLASVTDPKHVDDKAFDNYEGDICIIPPNGFVLAVSVERFNIPPNIVGLVFNKSTYARAGIVSPQTILEPGWEGYLTLEIANHTPLPAKVYANEGIAQILFGVLETVEVSYADRDGKYQNQENKPIPPRIKGFQNG